MASVNPSVIASSFLRALGAPDTPLMRKAVEIWLRKEGISSVKRNNPWNLHGGAACHSSTGYCPGGVNLPGAVGRANVGPGDQNVVVFGTLDAGVKANAMNLVRLQNSGYGYDKVIKYARLGDPVGFLNALALSSWSAGRYGIRGGGKNSLIVMWNTATGRHDDPYSYTKIGKTPTGNVPGGSPSTGNVAGGGSSSGGGLAILASAKLDAPKFIDIPEGKVLTAQDVDYIMSRYAASGFFADDTVGAAQSVTRTILNGAIGKPWTKDTRDGLQQQLLTAAANAIPAPLSAVASIGSAVVQFTGALFDPRKWLMVLALLAGTALTAWGGANVLRSAA